MAYFQTDVPLSISGVQPTTSSTSQKPTTMIPDEYLPIMTAFMSCYDALIFGNLTPISFQPDDLEQITPDDLEKMDIDWCMAMLTLRAKRFIKRTGMDRFKQGKTLGFDIKKVRCYNYDQLGHFVRNFKESSSKEQHEKNSSGKQAVVSPKSTTTSSSTTLVCQADGYYHWGDQEREAANKALMPDIEEKEKCVMIKPAEDLTAVPAEVMYDFVGKNEKLYLKKIHDISGENRFLIVQLTTQKNNNQILTERLQKAEKANFQVKHMGMDQKILFGIIDNQIHKKVTEGIGYNSHPPLYFKSGRFADMPVPQVPTPFACNLSADDYIQTLDSDSFASCAESDCVGSEDDCDESSSKGKV
ncbi:hypothetical protein L1987_27716 [Smallanthus sonchifolius]|uniref:Uncharacterized protein n=1 Tax=Smallanthus sonchifolius TaxID=185202 RepID=A0ACB9IBJ6_9ASTR|nr:hypothetical protein L1987_27716 [Smallanthus sonchifolius]